ncbi:MAG: alpha/beta hydrolase [Solirubrobacteraceae bacterium]
MSLRRSEHPLGSPWCRPLQGTLDELVVDSELLAGNPLGDPATRPLYVYISPGVRAGERAVPSIYVLQGFTGQLDKWHNRTSFEPNSIERLDAMFGANPGLDAIVVFVDAWTSLGGSQFLNSPATGRYMDYLCDEVVPFVDAGYPTLPGRAGRGIAGHSSGGYGAIVSSMLRPDVFGAFASHAGDSVFEIFIHDFVEVARVLRDRFDGSIEKLREAAAASDPFDWGTFGTALSIYAYAAAYSPDLDNPGKVLLPFEPQSGQVIPEVWDRWLALDPVRMAARHADALRSMRRIYLDAGRGDEYFLDVGMQAFARELSKLGVEHTFELFDGRHSGISHRYPGAIRELVEALA